MGIEIKENILIRFDEDSDHYIVPDNVYGIGDLAFAHADRLISLEIGDNVRDIGSNAFSGCFSLREISLPESVDHIGSGLFQKCWNLRSVRLPRGLTSIGTEMFEGCHALTDLYLPDTLENTVNTAFSSCRKLKNIYISPELIDVLPVSARYLAAMTYMENFDEREGRFDDHFTAICSYVRSRERSIVDLAINRRSSQAVRFMMKYGLISDNNIQVYIDKTVKLGRVEITALLLDDSSSVQVSDPLLEPLF